MRTRHFAKLPKPYTIYPNVVRGLFQKKELSEKILPQIEYVVDHLEIQPKHLHKYSQICHFNYDGTVPAIYLAVLAQSLQMHMMADEPFPFALLGLVHIRNRIKQYRTIYSDEILQLSCKFGELQPHAKGLQFDFIITAKVNDQIVFEGLTTYLSREKTSSQSNHKSDSQHMNDDQLIAQWTLPENLGRRYALISGDFNLIHLHALTAKIFGFHQAIAHGMWSKARSLAALNHLPEQYEADVWFKLPIFLPAQVEFRRTQSDQDIQFLLCSKKDQKPHLVGVLKSINI